MLITEDQIRDQLKLVIDPELFVNIVDLGLIYVVDIQPGDEDEREQAKKLLAAAHGWATSGGREWWQRKSPQRTRGEIDQSQGNLRLVFASTTRSVQKTPRVNPRMAEA